MQHKLNKTRRQFVVTITLFAAMSVLLLGVALYETNIISFNSELVSEDLQSAVEDHPEVKEYLETEHQNEAHFVTIANIIKDDQQDTLGRTMIWVTLPVLLVASGIGYLVAKRLLRPVEEAYEAQERFLADAAHELRNPLATMSAVVQNASANKKHTKEDVDKYMLQIRRQLGRMVRINEDLLYLERNVDNDSDEPVDVSELLHDVLEDLQPHATDQKLKFNTAINGPIMSDIAAKDFVRLAKNIIENAIKYSHKKSKTIEISLIEEKGDAVLEVSDNGIGIPADELENVKERFFRASNASDLPGSGLGMSIMQKVVDERGGSLTVTSVEGTGTTVTARI